MAASPFHVGIGPSNKIRYVLYVPGGCIWVHWTHGPINVISVYFKDSQFEFRVNQESYGFFQCCHWILHPEKNMGLETKILSPSILDVE